MYSLEFDEMQEEIRRLAAQFAKDEIASGVIERDKNAEFPKEIMSQMGEMGFLGMMVSEKWDGAQMDYISYVIAIEEIARVDASCAVVMSVQNSLVNWILETYAGDNLKEKYLKPLARGEMIGSYCLSEPEAGSDARSLLTNAKKVGDKWILNGTKNWITSAQNAGVFIVFAQTDSDLKHKGIACFAVPAGVSGLDIGLKEDKMGLRGSDTCEVGLLDVEIPEDHLIGEVGEGFYIAMKGLTGGRIGIAAQALGIARGAFDRALQYSTERKTMGVPICDHQLIKQKLAQMSMKTSAASSLVYKAAWMKSQNMDCNRESSEAKLYASTIANEVAKEAVQIHGGYGYVREYEVERMLRDAKVTEIYEGTSEIQHLVIARELINSIS
jgi:alkylation response protein AidB-like acyl-CoA dehydrogenase